MSPPWHRLPLQTTPHAVYVDWAWTLPDVRGRAVGAAPFVQAVAWAREGGDTLCAFDFITETRAAEFRRDLGFRPVAYLLGRVVDERVAWGRD